MRQFSDCNVIDTFMMSHGGMVWPSAWQIFMYATLAWFTVNFLEYISSVNKARPGKPHRIQNCKQFATSCYGVNPLVTVGCRLLHLQNTGFSFFSFISYNLMTYYNIKHTRKKFHIDGPEKSHRPQRKEPLVTC